MQGEADRVEIEGELKTALKERKVQFEMFFTLPDFSDISLRDYQETMQRPFFSLSKRKRIKPIEYSIVYRMVGRLCTCSN